MGNAATHLNDEVGDLDLERYVLELEADGLTVAVPAVTGVTAAVLECCTRRAAWADCDDPALMRELIGFDDEFPYEEQGQPVPILAGG